MAFILQSDEESADNMWNKRLIKILCKNMSSDATLVKKNTFEIDINNWVFLYSQTKFLAAIAICDICVVLYTTQNQYISTC